MGTDERAIRELHATWIEAVNAGDLVCLLSLMANDVVFLNPGQAPVGRDGFSPGFSAAHQQARIDCISELEDVVVVGEVAYTLSRDSLSLTPRARWRSDATRRSSYHGIPQTTRRPLAPGPRCPHIVPGGEAEVVRCKTRRANRCTGPRRSAKEKRMSDMPREDMLYQGVTVDVTFADPRPSFGGLVPRLRLDAPGAGGSRRPASSASSGWPTSSSSRWTTTSECGPLPMRGTTCRCGYSPL